MIQRRTPIPKKRKKPRKVSVDRDLGYRKWLNTRGCIACAKEHKEALVAWRLPDPTPCFSEAAHTKNNGMRSKGPDSSCVPLCHRHHMEYDGGRKTFERKYRLDMAFESFDLYQLYKLLKSDS